MCASPMLPHAHPHSTPAPTHGLLVLGLVVRGALLRLVGHFGQLLKLGQGRVALRHGGVPAPCQPASQSRCNVVQGGRWVAAGH